MAGRGGGGASRVVFVCLLCYLCAACRLTALHLIRERRAAGSRTEGKKRASNTDSKVTTNYQYPECTLCLILAEEAPCLRSRAVRLIPAKQSSTVYHTNQNTKQNSHRTMISKSLYELTDQGSQLQLRSYVHCYSNPLVTHNTTAKQSKKNIPKQNTVVWRHCCVARCLGAVWIELQSQRRVSDHGFVSLLLPAAPTHMLRCSSSTLARVRLTKCSGADAA